MDNGGTLTRIFRTKSAKQTGALGVALGAMAQEIYEHKKTLQGGLLTEPLSGQDVMLVGVHGEPHAGKSTISRGIARHIVSAGPDPDVPPPRQFGEYFWLDEGEHYAILWQSVWSKNQQNRVMDGTHINPHDEVGRWAYKCPDRTQGGLEIVEHPDIVAAEFTVPMNIHIKKHWFDRRTVTVSLSHPDAQEMEIFERHVNAPALAVFHG
jgi:hypothetical protein